MERNANSCCHESNCTYSDELAFYSFIRGFPDVETNIVPNYAACDFLFSLKEDIRKVLCL